MTRMIDAKVLAPAEPYLPCAATPMVHLRADLYCELLTWRFEQLGLGSEPEFQATRVVREGWQGWAGLWCTWPGFWA